MFTHLCTLLFFLACIHFATGQLARQVTTLVSSGNYIPLTNVMTQPAQAHVIYPYMYISDSYSIKRYNLLTNETMAIAGPLFSSADSPQGNSFNIYGLRGIYDFKFDPNDPSTIYFVRFSRIQKIVNGVFLNVAGSTDGFSGYSGDGSFAINAKLSDVYDIIISKSGDIFIADNGNYRIRMIRNGNITTLVGTGSGIYSVEGLPGLNTTTRVAGLAYDEVNGDLYFSESNFYVIRKYNLDSKLVSLVAGIPKTRSSSGIDEGDALTVKLEGPSQLVLDGNSLYFSDATLLKKYDLNTRKVSLIAGYYSNYPNIYEGPAKYVYLGFIRKLSIASTGELIITGRDRIVKYNSGVISHLFGCDAYDDIANPKCRNSYMNGPLQTRLGSTRSAAFQTDRMGNVKISMADTSLWISLQYAYSRKTKQDSISLIDRKSYIYTITTDKNSIVFCASDGSVSRLRDGVVQVLIRRGVFSPDGTLASAASVDCQSVAVNPISNEVYFIDQQRIRKINSIDNTIQTVMGGGSLPITEGMFSFNVSVQPDTLYFRENGDLYFFDKNVPMAVRMLSYSNSSIFTILGGTSSGTSSKDGTPARLFNMGYLGTINSLCLNKKGQLLYADGNKIRMIQNGVVVSLVGSSGIFRFLDDIISIPSNDSRTISSGYVRVVGASDNTVYYLENYDDYDKSRLRGLEFVCPGNQIVNDTMSGCECPSGSVLDTDGITCLFTCFSISSKEKSVCSGNGQCYRNDICDCNDGWGGSNCSLPKCFSIASDDASVCSGQGVCLTMDTCQCNQGRYGKDCSSYQCNGIFNTNTSFVCSGYGSCASNGTCQCNQGRYGQDCSLIACYGILSNNASVCSGNGKCYRNDICDCNDGWGGSNCSLPKCFSIASNDAGVCSGNGVCLTMDTCQCNQGRYGQDCSLFACYGILNNNASVCSGNGACVSTNTCKCNQGYTEDDCSRAPVGKSNERLSSFLKTQFSFPQYIDICNLFVLCCLNKELRL